ncbi:uncharacterized protein LOC128771593 isoform X2 [Synchiropus splendidus]|nr:uncharacterized protein LOC128771593 isoform X2 [Synchiropus splendidus]
MEIQRVSWQLRTPPSKLATAMQSQGSTSSQPSFDSLSSSDSLLFSDSEQAEDDSDVFLTDSSPSVIISGAARAPEDRARVSGSPGSQWACDGFTDKEEEEESFRLGSSGKATRSDLDESSSRIPKSEGDLLFAQKCAELQGFVRPLLELLNGLKKGRFDRGLSSFQQSVAMDRIQRIVGVLQRPSSGEKYLNTLLQVEMMLKLWFPQIQTLPVSSTSSAATSPARSLRDTSTSTPPHKHRDQLHIPVKKRRLSWTGTDSPSPSPVLLKCSGNSSAPKRMKLEDGESHPPPPSLPSGSNQNLPAGSELSQGNEEATGKSSEGGEPETLSKYKAGQSSEPSLTWVHVAPILSPRKACQSHKGATSEGDNQHAMAGRPPSRRGSPATQDSSISSTTPHKHPKNQKKSLRCQSQTLTAQQCETQTNQTCQGQDQSHDTVKPLSRVCPTPLET